MKNGLNTIIMLNHLSPNLFILFFFSDQFFKKKKKSLRQIVNDSFCLCSKYALTAGRNLNFQVFNVKHNLITYIFVLFTFSQFIPKKEQKFRNFRL